MLVGDTSTMYSARLTEPCSEHGAGAVHCTRHPPERQTMGP